MKRERCPQCGGPLATEGESWSRGVRAIRRSFRCRSCGELFEASVRWPHAGAPSERNEGRARSPFLPLVWGCAGLLVLWSALRTLDYSTVRVSVYAAVSRGAESFLHPVWAVMLLVLAALFLFLSRRRSAPLVAPTTVAPAVQLRAAPAGMISVVIEGSRRAGAGDRVVARNPDAEARVAAAFRALARRTAAFERADGVTAWSRAQIEEAQRELYSLGLAIGTELLGGSSEAADSLLDLPGDHLQLGIQSELAGIPWELMVARRGGKFLWQLFSVTRQLRDVNGSSASPSSANVPCRVLVIANPEAGVPGRELRAAEREAADILELGATRPDLMRVVRKSPRSIEELRGLLGEGFDVVHFAGHTGSSESVERGWVLADGRPVAPGDVFAGGARVPALVFANACSSNPDAANADTADAARTLMQAGVPAYLCTLAELHDAGSAEFSSAFYKSILGGATLGRAVTAARTALMGRHPLTWANYVLYGDPALTLCEPREGRIHAKNSDRVGD